MNSVETSFWSHGMIKMTNFHRYIISCEHFVVVRQAIVEDPSRRHLNLARSVPIKKETYNGLSWASNLFLFQLGSSSLVFCVNSYHLTCVSYFIVNWDLIHFLYFSNSNLLLFRQAKKRKNCLKAFVLKNNFSHNF